MKEKSGKIQDIIDKKFLEDRSVFLWGQVDDKSAKHVTLTVLVGMLHLDSLCMILSKV